MGAIQNTVYYCCVSKGGRILYSHSNGDDEIEKMAELCLGKAPPYHKWYFHTKDKKTYGFLMKDGYMYFAIVDEVLGNRGVLRFLENVRDEYRKVAKKGSSRSLSNSNSLGLQERLVPVIHNLISSLERVSETSTEWPSGTQSPHQQSPYNNSNAQIEAGGASTKLPLLGNNKKDKKKMKDHVISMRDIEMEEHRRSADRGVKVDSGPSDSNNQSGSSLSSASILKESGSMRNRANSQNARKKWCRLVRIILAIDVAVCLLLFVIWFAICGGTRCLS